MSTSKMSTSSSAPAFYTWECEEPQNDGQVFTMKGPEWNDFNRDVDHVLDGLREIVDKQTHKKSRRKSHRK
jgi:hypothetical protein